MANLVWREKAVAECEAGVTEVEVARIERAEHTGSVIRRARTDWPGETC